MAKRKRLENHSPFSRPRGAVRLAPPATKDHTYDESCTNDAYFEALLRGVSPDDTEKESQIGAGIGIVYVQFPQNWNNMSQDKRDKETLTASWMRPVTKVTNGLGDYTALDPDDNLCTEYIRDERYKYRLKRSDLRHEIKFLSLSALARPRAPAKPHIVKRGVLDSRVRVVRARLDSNGTLDCKHDSCVVCKDPLAADKFVFCVRCDGAICITCTRVSDKRPFRTRYDTNLGGLVLHGRDETPVPCRNCEPQSFVLVEATTEPPSPPNTMAISIDIGTEFPKVLLSYSAPGKAVPQAIDGLPSTSVWISKDGVVLDDDYVRDDNSTGDLLIKPIKLAICDEATREKIKQTQVRVEDIFRHFFNRIFNLIFLSAKSNLERWVQEVKSSDRSTTLYLSIAHPSGLGKDETDMLMTVLYQCGAKFLEKTLQIKDWKQHLVHMAESEAALVPVLQEDKAMGLELHKSTWLVFDSGGTTFDATIVQIDPGPPVSIEKYCFSGSLLYGAENFADDLARLTREQKADRVLSRKQAKKLIMETALDEHNEWPPGTKDIWDKLYANRLRSLKAWLDIVCKEATGIARKSSTKLNVLLTGGGFTDGRAKQEVENRFNLYQIHEEISTRAK
ncbi:hypothetical protein NX059_012256 [Plenodomus lindquistii]|nr:hypothetical protein NX059_012256 [Plenodomus lindquistii]